MLIEELNITTQEKNNETAKVDELKDEKRNYVIAICVVLTITISVVGVLLILLRIYLKLNKKYESNKKELLNKRSKNWQDIVIDNIPHDQAL